MTETQLSGITPAHIGTIFIGALIVLLWQMEVIPWRRIGASLWGRFVDRTVADDYVERAAFPIAATNRVPPHSEALEPHRERRVPRTRNAAGTPRNVIRARHNPVVNRHMTALDVTALLAVQVDSEGRYRYTPEQIAALGGKRRDALLEAIRVARGLPPPSEAPLSAPSSMTIRQHGRTMEA